MRSHSIHWIAWAVVVSVLVCGGPSSGRAQPDAAYARILPDRIELGNAALERIFSLAGGTVRTTAIRNKLANEEIRLESAEFNLRINETELLEAGDFSLEKSEVQDLDGGAKRLVLTLVCPRLDIEVQLRHEIAPGTPWMTAGRVSWCRSRRRPTRWPGRWRSTPGPSGRLCRNHSS